MAAIPSRIGRYEILRVLGEGGMGIVYEARQENPRRTVALKVIRASYLSPELLRRFGQESQVLGRLQHPGIAQVYEAGTVDDERGPALPYFAMEFVRGMALTEYAAKRSLSARERLELVAKVCDAVAHAHQKGIIHRDLKPANILVDESGQPKILDFGVARATDSDVQQATLRTDIGQILGTLPYMSPEQVSGDPAELDTRSDVYALGVIAYELLAGRLPYDLSKRALTEVARVICDEEPVRLSGIHRGLRGDVETLVAKALEKEKSRRYASAEAFAADIRRYLKDEPITARPASTWYQLQKFSRRNRGLVAGITAAFVLLVAGMVATGLALARALRAETSLTEQLAETEKAHVAEKARAEELKQVSDFQVEMLSKIDPTDAGTKLMKDIRDRFAEALAKTGVPDSDGADGASRVATLEAELRKVNATDAAANMIDRTILRPALDAIGTQFQNQPTVDASLRQTLASLYRLLGRYDDAEPLQQQVLATRRRVLGEEHPDTLVSINATGILLHAQGKLTEAETVFRDAIDKRARVLGPEHTDTVESMNGLGVVLHAEGKLAEAEEWMAKELEIRRRLKGEDSAETLTAINNLGLLLQAEGKFVEAQGYFEEALEGYERELGEEDVRTLTALSNLGFVLWAQGRIAETEPYWKDALEKRRRVLGEDHPDTLASISNMGTLLWTQGKKAEAEPYYLEGLEKSRRVLGDDHPTTLQLINNMGAVLLIQGRRAEAEPYLREALETRRRVLGEDHQDTLTSINNLASLLVDLKRPEESESLVAGTVERARRALPQGHWLLGSLLSQHAKALVALKRFREAEASALEARTILEAALGPENERTTGATKMLVDLYNAWHAAEPESGSDAKAAEWKAELDAVGAEASVGAK